MQDGGVEQPNNSGLSDEDQEFFRSELKDIKQKLYQNLAYAKY